MPFTGGGGNVTLSGENYLSLSGQAITAGAVNLSGSNVTGALAAGRFPALTGDATTGAGSLTVTIANDSVTYAKMQNVSATDKLLGRSTAGAGDVEEIACTAAGRAILDDADASAQRTTLGLGTLATQSGTFSGTSSGTNTGDQTITLTGDVTGSGTGSFAATIAAQAVGIAKMTATQTDVFFGRDSAGAGAGEEITVAAAKTLLNLTGTNSGDQTITLTGNVTGSGTGSFATTIAAGVVTEAMQVLADNTTANVTSTAHGYAPKSPADATKFLNGAATPAYAAVKDSDLSTSDITTNDATSTKHGFAPKAPASAIKYLDGGTTPAFSNPAISSYQLLTTATDGATVTFDLSTANKFIVTLGGNRTLALSNVTTGQAFTITLKQDGTGSRTVTWFSGISWAGGSAPTLTTTANKSDTFAFICTASGAYLGFTVGTNS